MKLLTIIDLETTGTDPKADRVVEIGAVLWSVEFLSVVAAFSTVVVGEGNAASAINGIPEGLIPSGMAADRAWRQVSGWVERSTAIVGHNADAFDRLFVPAGWDQGKPWIDTMTDVAWPRPSSSRSLVALTLAHGLGVSHAHRALTDCMLIARLFERSAELGGDIPAMLARALRPKGTYVVADTNFDEARNALAKTAGFRWEKPHWVRKMAHADVAGLPFAVRELKDAAA
jgi:DNA polymerase-3 subunit epsilon